MERRNFIRTSAVVAGAMTAPLPLFASQSRIKLGILGTGWWGTDVLLPNAIASGQFEIVALCDVDSRALNRAREALIEAGGSTPGLYADYRDMYENSGIQAVAIATPTHWHALQFIDACRKGIHVFLEKPVSYDIAEGLAMLEAKQKTNVVVQVDFPRVMVDTNGAGDGLAVGFLSAYYFDKLSLKDAITQAQIVARYTCSLRASTSNLISRKELDEYFRG